MSHVTTSKLALTSVLILFRVLNKCLEAVLQASNSKGVCANFPTFVGFLG